MGIYILGMSGPDRGNGVDWGGARVPMGPVKRD
jgi:hypothetical protein